jgi:hypothetical protein
VTVGSGEERTGVDLQLRVIPTARVSGTIVGPKGPAGQANVRLIAAGPDALLARSGLDIATTMSRKDGSFTFLGVPPGEYLATVSVAARSAMPAELSANAALSAMVASMNTGGDVATFAQVPITVSGADVTGVTMTLRE